MGQKIHPIAYRLGLNKDWQANWFSPRMSAQFLREDILIRQQIGKTFARKGISAVIIDRSGSKTKITIKTSKPGLLIGRGGTEIEKFRKDLTREIESLRKKYLAPNVKLRSAKNDIKIDVEEVKNIYLDAQIVAQDVAEQLEKRMPFRRALKQTIQKVMQQKEAQGVRIRVSGRLDGAEMSRDEWLADGKMPLQTLRSNIDYGQATSYNSYGTVGVKTWIFKGENFLTQEDEKSEGFKYNKNKK